MSNTKEKNKWKLKSKEAWNTSWQKGNLGNTLGTLGTGLTNIVQSGVANAQIADTSDTEAMIEDVENTQFSSGSYDNLSEQFNTLDLAKTDYDRKDVRGVTGGQMALNTGKSVLSGVTTGLQIGGPWGALAGGIIGLGSGLAGIFTGNARADRRAHELNVAANEANSSYLANFSNAISNTKNKMFNNSLLNVSAYGGPLFNLSGDFDNGVTFINEGGTHESNPMGGVLMGVDNEGTPNLVEEGEVIANDYVFSNRLKPTKQLLKEVGFSDRYADWTFAKIAEDLQKESSERPNDPISARGLADAMGKLTMLQEEIRMTKENKNNQYKCGGKIKVMDGTATTQHLNIPPLPVLPELEDIEIEYPDVDTFIPIDNDGYVAPFMHNGKTISDYEFQKRLKDGSAQIDKKFKKGKSFRDLSPLVDAATLIHNLKKPDYTNAERIENAGRRITRGSFTPLGEYVNLAPLDRNYYLNPYLSAAASNARYIQNSGANPNAVRNALLTNTNNLHKNIGTLLMQMEQENMNRELQSGTFNRGTSQANMSAGLQALGLDQTADKIMLESIMQGAVLRDSYDAARTAGITGSLNNLKRYSSDKYWQDVQEGWINDAIKSGVLKYLSDNILPTTRPASKGRKNGGYLTRRKK